VALVAPSGAGKSTLLHLAGLLEHPDAGEVYVDKIPTSRMADSERTRIRRTEIGFVYQFHHLLPEFSAVENIMLPPMIRGLGRKEANRRALELLAYLGLRNRATHRPSELSGGEQQRVASHARWPMRRASCSPMSPLETRSADGGPRVQGAYPARARLRSSPCSGATHNMEIAGRMDRRVTLRNGRWSSRGLRSLNAMRKPRLSPVERSPTAGT
jgi:lipoprotein-releasing system ATP-binding protein